MSKEDTDKVENYCMNPKSLWLSLQMGPITRETQASLVNSCLPQLPHHQA